ncbi:MAG: molybdopterin-dependent oxidoreductase, partial [Desulfobulbaceae bacterium]|nr:molybdopterin-dependent oxidoreductase [Desulfobulbaceae bacterium]
MSRVAARADSGVVAKPLTSPGSFTGTETRPSVCEMCFWRCQIVGKVRDGRLVKIEGNPKSVNNGKSICARGNAGVQLLYDPDRLKYPMKNVGERGKPVWKRISWEAALDECATRLMAAQKSYGPHALAVFPHGASAKYPMQFFEMTGTENVSEASFFQCRGIRDMGYLATFGFGPDENVDMANAKAMLFIGTHIGENVHVSHVKSYLKGLAGGAKLIVVDPRFSASASKADIWVKIKPGTDTALLLAIMNHLVVNNRYDKEFVANSCAGFDEFKTGIAHATLDWAAGICEVPAAQIREVAEILAQSAPNVSIHPGRHVSWHGTDFQRMRAHACLTALLGAYAVPGGLIRPKSGIKLGKVDWPKGEHNEEYSLIGSHKFKPPGMPTE